MAELSQSPFALAQRHHHLSSPRRSVDSRAPLHFSPKRSYGSFDAVSAASGVSRQRSSRRHRRSVSRNSAGTPHGPTDPEADVERQMSSDLKGAEREREPSPPRPGAMPRPVAGSSKLGTFSGVFVPTSLNVLSILMFLRFGLILGQSGLLGMMAMLLVSYSINLITTLSISAIATNGTVRGGGAYYLISRSLGPEFGGSIGVVFYLGLVFNTGMNAVGLIDCILENFGTRSGNWAQWLLEGPWWNFLWATIVMIFCTGVCLAGSSIFARASNGLLAILLISTFSIPLSAAILSPFQNARLGIEFTGLSLTTLKENLLPRLTSGAAGSQLDGEENFQNLFGILFPATGGIFAGASMSGDLKHPSKAIPKGTLSGLALTFVAYSLVIIALAASVTRQSFYNNENVIQDTNMSQALILLGEAASSLFSSLMGVIGSAKLLQALARDNLIPGLSIFGYGTQLNDEPVYAILITYIVVQFTLLANINQIASFVTMAYLMTFLVTNLACFLLKISSAPNFRPSFRYFTWQSAFFGASISAATMFFVDGVYATLCFGLLVIIFLVIHYTTPPKSWGDVSQSLIYHQVRKYLLRLRQEHVKFWRPQILLLVNDPRRQYPLIQFCNDLKKGALFMLGHVIVSEEFGSAVPEARKQQSAWMKYIDFSRIKAFVNIAISPTLEWGTRNIVLSAGLGGMRPNIAIMGAYNLDLLRQRHPMIQIPSPQASRPSSRSEHREVPYAKGRLRPESKAEKVKGALPTDENKPESDISPVTYVTILEDLVLRFQINVAVAKGFRDLDFPTSVESSTKKYIDLWPIQMSASITTDEGEIRRNVLTTNFDTYTLILQLGCILNTVPRWKDSHILRVAVFVEYESDVEEERSRVKALLINLRIKAEVLVFWLASGDIKTYNGVVNGDFEPGPVGEELEREISSVLEHEGWWNDVQKVRGRKEDLTPEEELADLHFALSSVQQAQTARPSTSAREVTRLEGRVDSYSDFRRLLRQARRRRSSGNLSTFRGRLTMTTARLDDDMVYQHAALASASEDSDSVSSDSESSLTGEDEEALSVSASESASVASGSREALLVRRDRSTSPLSIPTVRATEALHDSESTARSPLLKSKSSPVVPRVLPSRPGLSESEAPRLSPAHIDIKSASTNITPPGPSTRLAAPGTGTAPSTPSGLANMLSPPSVSTPGGRPRISRRQSGARFSSLPVPRTAVSSEEGPGPSIMFTEPPSQQTREQRQSIYERNSNNSSSNGGNHGNGQGRGKGGGASVSLSFNDLPGRAQHLILNELIRRESENTAVVFTTLPTPAEGTCCDEADSVGYLSDLEVLCEGLPPVLMIHSNSMTVTTNL